MSDRGGMDENEVNAIARLRRGDISGLETLVRTFHHPALRVAFLITHNRAQAEDVVQAAFLRAYERIDHFDPARPFGPWFMRCVANDALAVATRYRHVPLDGSLLVTLERAATPDGDPEDLLLAAETRAAIRAGLDRLTPEQRAAIVARYYLDLHGRALARELDAPQGTVRRRLHDARARLRHALPAWLGYGPTEQLVDADGLPRR